MNEFNDDGMANVCYGDGIAIRESAARPQSHYDKLIRFIT